MTPEPVESISIPEATELHALPSASVVTLLTEARQGAEAAVQALQSALAGADPVASLVLLPLIRSASDLEVGIASLRSALAECAEAAAARTVAAAPDCGYRAAYLHVADGHTVLTRPEHAGWSDAALRAEALAEAKRAGLIDEDTDDAEAAWPRMVLSEFWERLKIGIYRF